eukprot:2778346-Rhodomonas_salina.1
MIQAPSSAPCWAARLEPTDIRQRRSWKTTSSKNGSTNTQGPQATPAQESTLQGNTEWRRNGGQITRPSKGCLITSRGPQHGKQSGCIGPPPLVVFNSFSRQIAPGQAPPHFRLVAVWAAKGFWPRASL